MDISAAVAMANLKILGLKFIILKAGERAEMLSITWLHFALPAMLVLLMATLNQSSSAAHRFKLPRT